METPLWQALQRQVAKKQESCHTPGHKNGRLLPAELKTAWGEAVFQYDLTEIGDLDVLQAPQGVLRASQEGLAEAANVAFARYLVAGSTLGILAACLALAQGKTVLLPRHAHPSVYHGLALAQGRVIYLTPEIEERSGQPLGIAPETLREALKAHPEAELLILTDPTYHGFRWQNELLLAMAKEAGLKVIVDAAHGAHYGWSKAVPQPLAGDVVIVSAHKTLPVLTGASVLYGNDPALATAIDRALSILQTTSPSYLMLASLELAFAWLSGEGQLQLTAGLKSAEIERKKWAQSAQSIAIVHRPSYQQDPLRWLLVSAKMKGTALAAGLRQRGVEVETADERSCLLLLPLSGPTTQLLRALKEVDSSFDVTTPPLPWTYPKQKPETLLPLEKALFAPSHPLPLAQSIGQVMAEFIAAYPPGMPLLVPGEEMTEASYHSCRLAGLGPTQLVRVIRKEEQ